LNRRGEAGRVWRPCFFGALGAAAVHHAPAAPATTEVPAADKFEVSALAAQSYDSNLFRLPANIVDLAQLIAPGARRADYISRVSVGASAQRTLGSQAIVLDLDVDDNRYRYNGFLNNVSGRGKLLWDWKIGSAWSGQLGADYARALTSFTNNKVFARDLLDTQGYFLDGNYHLRSGWSLTFGARHAQSVHSAEAQAVNDSTSTSGGAGIVYESGAGNLIGAEYRYGAATYPHDSGGGGGFNPRYRENTWDLYFKDAPTAKIQLLGGAGYLEHRYPDAHLASLSPDFSGAVWHFSLQYQATDKTMVVLAEQRQLRAYLDSESDYFVSNGVTLTPSWTPTDKLSLSLKYAYERQSFLGSNPSSVSEPDLPGRVDTVSSGQADVTYLLLRRVQLNLLYRYENRDTNRSSFAYKDQIVAFGFRVTTSSAP
jgi:Putative beta-barrel porin 2